METTMNNYATKDFYSACLLRASGFAFQKLERGDHKFSVFIFADPKSLADEVIKKYWSRKLQIEAKDFVDSIHDMKAILYSN